MTNPAWSAARVEVELGEEIMRKLSSLLVQGAQLKVEMRGVRDKMEMHEKQDNERFLLLREDMSRVERTLTPKVEELAKADAETTQRVTVLTERDANRTTQSLTAQAEKSKWILALVMAAVGAALTLLIKFVTS